MYGNKIDLIKNFCNQKKIQVFNFLQPDLFFKNKKSLFEKSYEKFEGEEKKKFIIEKYNLIKENYFNKNDTEFFKNFSLLDCFDEYENSIFFDRVHVSDYGNKIISEKISHIINKFYKDI